MPTPERVHSHVHHILQSTAALKQSEVGLATTEILANLSAAGHESNIIPGRLAAAGRQLEQRIQSLICAAGLGSTNNSQALTALQSWNATIARIPPNISGLLDRVHAAAVSASAINRTKLTQFHPLPVSVYVLSLVGHLGCCSWNALLDILVTGVLNTSHGQTAG